MKVLITGGMGVNGAVAARLMVEEGLRPVLLDNRADFSLIQDIKDRVDCVEADVCDQRALEKKATLHLNDTKNVNLPGMLQILRNEYKVRTVACEGGPTLFRALLEQGLIDRLNLTIAPLMFGGEKAPTLTGLSSDFLPASVHCSLTDMRTVGEECFLTYRIKHPRRRH